MGGLVLFPALFRFRYLGLTPSIARFSNLAGVEIFARLDSKGGSSIHSRLVGADATIRNERRRSLQQDTTLSINGDVAIAPESALFPLNQAGSVLFPML